MAAPRKASSPSDAIAPFRGFGAGALRFFEQLAAQQNRDWFLANKHTYESDVRDPMTALISELCARFERAKIPLTADPRRAMFRLNRDIRFSKDKSPYKTHAGAVMHRPGQTGAAGMLYIHIAPQGCFAAAGFYQAEPPALDALRTAIAKPGKAFAALEATLAKAKLKIEGHGDALKRLPRGFETVTDPHLGALLRQKSFMVQRTFTARAIREAKLVDTIAEFAINASPFLEFGQKALTRKPTPTT